MSFSRRQDLILLVFFLQGVATLYPWSVLVTVPGFFSDQLKNIGGYKENFHKHAVISYMAINYIAAACTLLQMSKLLENLLTAGSYLLHCFVLFVLFFVAFFKEPKIGLYPMTALFFGLFMITGAATALMQSNLFASSSKCKGLCTTWMLFGQAVAGIFASLLSAVLGYLTIEQNVIGCIYFGIGLFVMASNFAIYLYLPKLVEKNIKIEQKVQFMEINKNEMIISETSVNPENLNNVTNGVASSDYLTVFELFKRVYPFSVLMIVDFTTMLTVFPGITMYLTGKTIEKNQGIFSAWGFVVFNLFDSFGRFFPTILSSLFCIAVSWYAKKQNYVNFGKVTQKMRISFLIIISVLRLGILFIVPFCKMNKKITKRSFLSYEINDSVTPMLMIALLGFSTGAICTCCFSYSQLTKVPTVKNKSKEMREMVNSEREKVGRIMTFSLLTGLVIGSCLTIAYKEIIILKITD